MNRKELVRTIGFPISRKENEKRRALIPDDIKKIHYPSSLYFEAGYGSVLGLKDEDYIEAGANICSREDVLEKEVLCDPKIGDAEYLCDLKGKTIFGWIHAVQNRDITDLIINNRLTAYAWEEMFEKGRHVFWRNNELAGEAAILHAFQCFGRIPYETKVAVIGRGNTARGAVRVLNMLGAEVVQYDRRMEELLREEINYYDVVINCVLWDVMRKDHIIYLSDLKRMKNNSMIVDVSCDRGGAIESSVPTTIQNPTYVKEGVLHYVVDHTPSIFYKTFSVNNSKTIVPYINMLVENKQDDVLANSMIIENGKIIDNKIVEYQNRNNCY